MKRLIIASIAIAAAGQASALYKVVGPDGSVTYTDRAPGASTARVTTLGREAAVSPAGTADAAALPSELREASTRHPVTLYTAANCAPCDDARRMLQQRGVPFTEKRVETEDDVIAFERLTGARVAPAATIGTQVLRGWVATDWTAFLDAASYPRDSRLPRGWTPPPVTPLAARPGFGEPAAQASADAAPRARSARAAPPPEPTPTSGFRF